MSNPFANYDPGEERDNRRFEPAKIIINGSEHYVLTFSTMRRNSHLGIDQPFASVLAIPTSFDLEIVNKYMDGTRPLTTLIREVATAICQVGVGGQNLEGGINFDAEDLTKVIFYFPAMGNVSADEVLFNQSSKILPAVLESYNYVLSKLIDMRETNPKLVKCLTADFENGGLVKSVYFQIENVMELVEGDPCQKFINRLFPESERLQLSQNPTVISEEEFFSISEFGPVLRTRRGRVTLN